MQAFQSELRGRTYANLAVGPARFHALRSARVCFFNQVFV